MPQADKQDIPLHKPETLEGQVFIPSSPTELQEALRLAFDYRGDVTLQYADGTTVVGFVSNHDRVRGCLDIFVTEGRTSEMRQFPDAGITRIEFSGPDTAFGKSWEDWTKKSQAVRELEAQRLREEAAKLGHL
ncbi:MAG: hypothetical protein OHK005_16730 [Candidatus Methylacidiphilales bacterium]